ncbi:hypothetical protein FKM82_013210 [Ascaphus truei]
MCICDTAEKGTVHAAARERARHGTPANACTDTRAVHVHEHEHLMTSGKRRPHGVCVSEAAAWNAQQGEAKCWIWMQKWKHPKHQFPRLGESLV